jgi:hypothetical protein
MTEALGAFPILTYHTKLNHLIVNPKTLALLEFLWQIIQDY